MKTHVKNFIENIIDKDLKERKYSGQVHTRFPPEPNGYLHIGHAKSICLNFGLKETYFGQCNLRFDDTNPESANWEYAEAIKEDIRWLGFKWNNLCYASSYFDRLYEFAVELIKKNKAYVDSLNEEQVRKYRGDHNTPGRNSPYRDRSVRENLNLFERMKKGEFKDGEHTLRAKIDMSSGNMNMRDPLIYRIRHQSHPMTGSKWCIYPLYDFTHGLSDAIEEITHSTCTLEFEDHRLLYDWFLEQLDFKEPPKQIEFSKLFLSHVIVSKRNLKKLVEENHVTGWDDPRMPTLSGFRRRGYTPESIREFCRQVGISKAQSLIDYGQLEECLRSDLDRKAMRRMVVLKPLKVTLTNYDKTETLQAPNHPKNESMGARELAMSRNIWIDHDDFMEKPSKKYFRLKPGGEVRLRHSYIIRCEEVIKNEKNEVIELKCRIDPNTLGKNPEDRKVKGIIHWVCADNAQPVTVRVYDRLFTDPHPASHKDKNFLEFINADSLKVLTGSLAEASLSNCQKEESFQFERVGYFCLDRDSTKDQLIFNRSVSLKSTWNNVLKKND